MTSVTRRRLLLAGASLAVVASGCGEAEEPPRTQGPIGDADLRLTDFLLGLETVERDFYARALEGGALGGEAKALIERLRTDEDEHVARLRKVLRDNGFRPSEPPRVGDLPSDEGDVLSLAAELEDLGANAYSGAAGEFEDRNVLEVALAIHSVEGRHAAAVHRLLGTDFAPEGAFASPLNRREVLDELQGFMA